MCERVQTASGAIHMAQWVKVLTLQAREPEFSSGNPQGEEAATSDLQNKTKKTRLLNMHNNCLVAMIKYFLGPEQVIPVILALEMQRQRDYCPTEAILVHITSFRLHCETLSHRSRANPTEAI